MRGGSVYIMTDRTRGLPYIGDLAHLAARVHQHRTNRGAAFCRRYGRKRLVLAVRYDTIEGAIAREKQLEARPREWKITLIKAADPDWSDLYDQIA